MTHVSKSRATELLSEAAGWIQSLMGLSYDSAEFKGWERDTRISIAHVFGKDSDNLKEFERISYIPYSPGIVVFDEFGTPSSTHNEQDYRKSFENGLQHAKWLLKSMIREIEVHWGAIEPKSSESSLSQCLNPSRVFVVHGRDDGAREMVARLIEQLDLEAVILEEQPSGGRTVISKFKEEAVDIGFAVVLLTPDDEGRRRGGDNEMKPRARQNVVLELGFFLASLGQERVCALLKGDVEIPSDIDGVIYLSMNETNSWKFDLVKELAAAGFNVDANKVLKTDKTN